MKTEFLAAITQLSAERNLPKEEVLEVLESALASAYKKQAGSPDEDIFVKIDPFDSKIRVYTRKTVVETINTPSQEILLKEARKLRATAQTGEIIEIESTPKSTGRITIQSVKQTILQRLREAERHVIYGEFVNREGEIISGIIQFIESNRIYVRLNRTEAILPLGEQIAKEHYYKGQRLQLYILRIERDTNGPQIIVSRSHPNLVRCFFELEIPEVHSGIVEVKAIAREAGQRSKVAVATSQESIDPVGCCLGTRGIRLQSIIKELNGEKIDVIQWHPDPEVFIANALNPAQVISIEINEAQKTAMIIVPDKQLSLAIGKEGQNARLAAKLTGWRIDIKSVSAAEAEEAAYEEPKVETAAEEANLPPIPQGEPVPSQPATEEEESAALISDEELTLAATTPGENEKDKQIRFAEDILPALPQAGKQSKKKPRKGKARSKQSQRTSSFSEEDGYEE
ncbi:MAG: transcription termination factor NusA [Chloroflexota bacterium]|nr:transcription termination factor NusA [Chloroflexota bacterium]